MGPETSVHALNSMLREKIAEHLLTGELLRRLWQLGIYDAEILRSEFDAGGYDLVVSWREIIRHIQFKTIILGGKAAGVNVSNRLAEKPAGCVVWMVLDDRLDIRMFRWFGGKPREKLPEIASLKMATHTKGDSTGKKAERVNHRVVPRGRFVELHSIDALIGKLLGDIQGLTLPQ